MYKTINIGNKKVCYTDNTSFIVQVGKGKSAYKNKYIFKGDVQKAAFYYACINVGNGYKKRLIMSGANKPVLARMISC